MDDQPFEILVVDDDPSVIDLFKRLGKQAFSEATFTWTKSHQETISYLSRSVSTLPRLILLDIDLQMGTDGLSALPELVSRFSGRFPIIMFSNLNEQDKIQRAYSYGAVAYTQKPQELQEWKDYISILRRHWYETVVLPLPTLRQA
ncbi:response regulator [Spirosoma spitsbergense]|jgi:CheY-like chemotaxis protein|uniref:response regulator n=1 Tax=Spirosoma spitsbergense TaxID=431554 RepID=UPI00037426F2|nr:response regulator [Spirosoma spitsbergense]